MDSPAINKKDGFRKSQGRRGKSIDVTPSIADRNRHNSLMLW